MIIAWLLLLPFLVPLHLLAAFIESLLSLLASLARLSFTFFARSSSVLYDSISSGESGGRLLDGRGRNEMAGKRKDRIARKRK
jgi:hypothetical protein